MQEKRGRGYIGRSMSVNAKIAYDNDIKPLSRWRKADLVDIIEDAYDAQVKRIKGSYKNYLVVSEWHHTGPFFQATNFYRIDEEKVARAVEAGDIIFYTEAEVLALEEASRVEEEARQARMKEWAARERAEDEALQKELRAATKTERLSKRGTKIITVHITKAQPLLYAKLSEQRRIAIKNLAAAAGIDGLVELKLEGDPK